MTPASHELTTIKIWTPDHALHARLVADAARVAPTFQIERLTAESIVSALNPTDIVLVDAEPTGAATLLGPPLATRALVVLLYRGELVQALNAVIETPAISHYAGINSPNLLADVLEIARDRQDSRSSLASARQLLPARFTEKQMTITGNEQRDAYLDLVGGVADELSSYPDFSTNFAAAAWELVMNSIYSAPVDRSTGNQIYIAATRSSSVKLKPSEYATLACGADGSCIAAAIRDPFGSLTRARIEASLRRCLSERAPQYQAANTGSGIGLYMVLNAVHRFDIVVVPGQSATTTIMAHATKRRHAFAQRELSINLTFLPESAA